MIPTAMLIGLLLGLALRARWSIPATGVTWAAIIAVSVDSDQSVLLVAFLLGCANGAVGVTIGRGLRLLIGWGVRVLAVELASRRQSRHAA